MTLIHMAPQVPIADRLYQGRVHLVEVKNNSNTVNKSFGRNELDNHNLIHCSAIKCWTNKQI